MLVVSMRWAGAASPAVSKPSGYSGHPVQGSWPADHGRHVNAEPAGAFSWRRIGRARRGIGFTKAPGELCAALGGSLTDLGTRRKAIHMAWITWIETEPDDTANEAVQELYERTRDAATGCPPDTVRLTSLSPQVAGLLHDLHKAIYHGARGLTLREIEIAALVVSTYNGCVH
jgi:hypothetical protein